MINTIVRIATNIKNVIRQFLSVFIILVLNVSQRYIKQIQKIVFLLKSLFVILQSKI